MADQNQDISHQSEELLTLRVTAAVTDAVDQAIRRKYMWVNVAVAAAIMVAGIFGGATLITSLVRERVDTAVKANDHDIQRNRENLAEVAGEIKVRVAQFNDSNELLQKIQKDLTDIDSTINERALIKNMLSAHSLSISALEAQTKNLADLATTVEQLRNTLASIATKVQIDTTALTKAPSPQEISASLTDANTGLASPTVFLQFSGAATRSDAQQISAALKQRGFRVPGEERVASNVKEVRYFYDGEDEKAAQKLAADTMEILSEKGFGEVTVQTKNLRNYSRTKPQRGTLELWLGGLPALKP